MNILDPSYILSKGEALNFINYNALNEDNREGILGGDLWMIPSLGELEKYLFSYSVDGINNKLEFEFPDYEGIQDKIKSDYDVLEITQMNSARIPICKFIFNKLKLISNDKDKVTYQFESKELIELNK